MNQRRSPCCKQMTCKDIGDELPLQHYALSVWACGGGGALTLPHTTQDISAARSKYELSPDFLLGKNVWTENASPTKKTCADKKNVRRHAPPRTVFRAPPSTFLAAHKLRGARFWQKFACRRTFWVKLSRALFIFAPRQTFEGALWRASPALVQQGNVRRQIVHGTPDIMTFRKVPMCRHTAKSRVPTHRCTVRPEIVAQQNVRQDIGRRKIAHRPIGTLTCKKTSCTNYVYDTFFCFKVHQCIVHRRCFGVGCVGARFVGSQVCRCTTFWVIYV